MTQIITITNDWLHDLHVGIYEFEKEYEVKPHIYANPELYDCMACTNNFIRIKPEGNTYASYNIGLFEGCSIEFDSSVAKNSIILKG